MTDKERILLYLVSGVVCRSLYDSESVKKWRDMQPGIIGGSNPLQPGDLVVAATAIEPHDFMVGFVDQICPDCVVIREIGGKRLCNYYNELFYRVDKDILGYEILEGIEYETYRKVLKAFDKTEYSDRIRFQSIHFEGKTCVVKSRRSYSDETVCAISFEYNKRTTIKSITELLDKSAETAFSDENKEESA